MNDVIRIGKVSSVNGCMVRVTYPDRDNSVTAELPVFSFTGEYKMPKVGSQVLVVHLSNGTSAGVCLGNYWNDSNRPAVSSGFRKELGDSTGEAYIECSGGKVTIHASQIILDAPTNINGISFGSHTHTGAHGETSGPH